MCKALHIKRNVYYYKEKSRQANAELSSAIIHEFYLSRSNYGTRKLKIQLSKNQNEHSTMQVSRRKIGQLMAQYQLILKYTLKHNRWHKSRVNREDLPNLVERDFTNRKPLEVVVSDLRYVKCAGKWHYICLLLDLHNRKIIGSDVGRHKDAELVKTAFYVVQSDIRRIEIFHTDRGSEFKNHIIDEIIFVFKIKRSFSKAGAPIDNACAESIYNIVKTEFTFNESFVSIDELELKWFDYVNWYNNVRIHGSLGYLTPNEYYRANLCNAFS